MSSRDLLQQYLDRRIERRELRARLSNIDWPAPGQDRLASKTLRLMGEASSAGWTDDDLRDELLQLLLASNPVIAGMRVHRVEGVPDRATADFQSGDRWHVITTKDSRELTAGV